MVKEGFRSRGAGATKGLKGTKIKELAEESTHRDSLMVQRLRICLPAQGMWVQSPGRGGRLRPHMPRRSTKPMYTPQLQSP